MSSLFNTVLYQPLFNLLVFLYEKLAFNDLGVAIILLTLIIRVILYPLFYKSFKNQTLLQKIQPDIQKIQHDHKNDREKQAQALLALYQQHKVNPFTSFLLVLVQLPILIVIYQLILKGFSPEAFQNLYSFISVPEEINNTLLGLIDLSKRSIVVVGLAAVLQYFQGKLSLPANSVKISRQMVFIGPVLTLIILTSLPAAVGLYWAATSGFSIIQQIIINKRIAKENGEYKTNNSKTP